MKTFRKLPILFEDNHLLFVNKPAGMPVQSDESGDLSLLELAKEYIKIEYDKPGAVFLGLVHRLDRPVSGVVVLARTSKALSRMNDLFRNREVDKTYWAITEKRPPHLEKKLHHYLQKDRRRNVTQAYGKNRKGAKKATLEYKMLAEIAGHCLLEVHPDQGRPHQIRAQLGAHGSPIRGDLKYGSTVRIPQGFIYLHALRLSFIHPVRKEPISISISPPDDQIWQLFNEFLPAGILQS